MPSNQRVSEGRLDNLLDDFVHVPYTESVQAAHEIALDLRDERAYSIILRDYLERWQAAANASAEERAKLAAKVSAWLAGQEQ